MKKMAQSTKVKLIKSWLGILSFVLSLFGISVFSSCDQEMMYGPGVNDINLMYGPGPYVLKEVTGKVKSKIDDNIIKNIFISVYDSSDKELGQGYTDEDGKYKLIIKQYGDMEVTLKILDVDGNDNGSYNDKNETLKISSNKDKYELDIVLDPKK
jgi:putative lipoprotein (rSAM/lipoprotein system)